MRSPAHLRVMPDEVDLGGGVRLRALALSDLAVILEAITANLEHLRPFMPWASAPVNPETQGEWLRAAATAWEEGRDYTYGIFRADEFLGSIGLHTRSGPRVLEIGYWIRADEQGRGLMTVAARALTRLAVEVAGVDRVDICCDEANTRSAAIPLRLGYKLRGVEPREIQAPAETGTHQLWSIDAADVRAWDTAAT